MKCYNILSKLDLKNSRRILVFSNMSQPAEIIFTGRFMGLRSGSCDI